MSELWPKLYSQCIRKEKHSYNVANKIVQRKKKQGVELYKYLCPYCNGYHITKQPQSVPVKETSFENPEKPRTFLDINQFLQWYYDEFGQKIFFKFGYTQSRNNIKWHCWTITQFGEFKEEGSTKKQAKKRVIENIVYYLNENVKFENRDLL